MAVIFETSIGDLTIDLFVDDCPQTCKNFLKLCKIKYYNNTLFYNVQRNFVAQAGDPENTGKGGSSVFGLLYGEQARFFDDEIRHPKLRHTKRGMVGMASAKPNLNGSEFYIQLANFALDSLDEKHTIFGEVSEGLELLERMNEVAVDEGGRPLQNVRIRHTIVLDDPFEDPPGLEALIPESSPEPVHHPDDDNRIEEDWAPREDDRPPEEIEKELKAKEAQSRAVVLEMIGDLPDADVKPPSNAVFICKLNPVTTEEDLEVIFSQCGKVTSCDIVRDWKTGDSLCYGFIGFETDDQAEKAYFKMNNVLIDDRRIKVDFSQSVSHIWKQFKRFGRKGGPPMEGGMGARGGQSGPTPGRLELKSGFARGLNAVPLFQPPPQQHRERERGGRSDRDDQRPPPSEDRKERDEPSARREEDRTPRNVREAGEDRGGSRRRSRSRDREGRGSRRERSRDRDRYRRRSRTRSRSPSRDRSKRDRHHDDRPRERRRDRTRSRSRSRDRSDRRSRRQ